MDRINDLMFGILEDRTGHNYEFWRERTRRHETWVSARDAKELGLVDEVL